jgi:hypothetical protein
MGLACDTVQVVTRRHTVGWEAARYAALLQLLHGSRYWARAGASLKTSRALGESVSDEGEEG